VWRLPTQTCAYSSVLYLLLCLRGKCPLEALRPSFTDRCHCHPSFARALKHLTTRDGQNWVYIIYAPYMTVYLVISLPKIPYMHRIYMVLANPTHDQLLPFGTAGGRHCQISPRHNSAHSSHLTPHAPATPSSHLLRHSGSQVSPLTRHMQNHTHTPYVTVHVGIPCPKCLHRKYVC
jgi:hypothetical protein